MPNDIGKFVGLYLQALACLSIISMVVSTVFFGRLMVDFSVLFLFWAGAALIRHHQTARKWTLGVCILLLLSLVAVPVTAAISGTDQITLMAFGFKIEHLSVLSLVALTGLMAVMVGFPVVLLLTPQARREFQRPTVPNNP